MAGPASISQTAHPLPSLWVERAFSLGCRSWRCACVLHLDINISLALHCSAPSCPAMKMLLSTRWQNSPEHSIQVVPVHESLWLLIRPSSVRSASLDAKKGTIPSIPPRNPECWSLNNHGRLHEEAAASSGAAGGAVAGVAEVPAILGARARGALRRLGHCTAHDRRQSLLSNSFWHWQASGRAEPALFLRPYTRGKLVIWPLLRLKPLNQTAILARSLAPCTYIHE